MNRRGMIIASDCISEWIRKGEVIDRYYNPQGYFGSMHVVLLHEGDRSPDRAALERLCGTQDLTVTWFPLPREVALTHGWNQQVLKQKLKPLVRLIGDWQPDLIRCHSAGFNSYVALMVKQEYGIPFVVSLHTNQSEVRKRESNFLKRVRNRLLKKYELDAMFGADKVLPVYQPIVPYLESLGVKNFEVAYNTLNTEALRPKESYATSDLVQVVSVGRQYHEKNPENLIKAIARMPQFSLTLFGDGEYHDRLVRLAQSLDVADRVVFFKALPNSELCRRLPEFDIFATHSDWWEFSKSVIEALVVGLPVVLNKRVGERVQELDDEICFYVENSVEGYEIALKKLAQDCSLREKLGRSGRMRAERLWEPSKTEKNFARIYDGIVRR